MDATATPRLLVRHWIALLLAPVSWAAALGILFSLNDEACKRGSHAAMLGIAGICVLMAAAPAPWAWWQRRAFDESTSAGARARFMLGVATGASIIFALVLSMMTIPVLFLSACRT
jgi:hypothetical protein